jgi:lipopolysaccharide export system protein LptA
VRRRNTPDTGVRIGVFVAALWTGLAGLMLITADATPARCEQQHRAAATPAAAPSAAARPAAAAAKKGGASQAAGDAKSGGQNSPFGMMKFSGDNGPIQIKADSLNLDYKNNTVEFVGAVHAAQSGTLLTSKTLKVLYGSKFGEIKQVIAVGDVKMSQGGRWATGQRAVLDEVKHTVEMTGEPVVHDGPDSVAGRRIIIYLDSEKSFVEGATAVIFPRNGGKTDHEAAD